MSDPRLQRASELALQNKDGEALALLRSSESAHRQPAVVQATLEELLLRFVAAGDFATAHQLLLERHPDETRALLPLFANDQAPLDRTYLTGLTKQHPVGTAALLIALLPGRLPAAVPPALARWRLGDASDTDVIQSVVHESQERTQAIRELAQALPFGNPLQHLSAVGDGVQFDSTPALVASLAIPLILLIWWVQC